MEVVLHTKMSMLRQKLNILESNIKKDPNVKNAWDSKEEWNNEKQRSNRTIRFLLCSYLLFCEMKGIIPTYLHTFKNYIPSRKLQQCARYGLPSVALVFLCIFFLIGVILGNY